MLAIDAREKRWHKKVVCEALAQLPPTTIPLVVRVASGPSSLRVTDTHVVVTLDCREWMTMRSSVEAARLALAELPRDFVPAPTPPKRVRAEVEALIPHRRVVIFDVPIAALDEIAFSGTCRFEDGREFKDPTWAEVAVIANEQLLATGDRHHVWLEGLSLVRRDGSVSVLELDFGS